MGRDSDNTAGAGSAAGRLKKAIAEYHEREKRDRDGSSDEEDDAEDEES